MCDNRPLLYGDGIDLPFVHDRRRLHGDPPQFGPYRRGNDPGHGVRRGAAARASLAAGHVSRRGSSRGAARPTLDAISRPLARMGALSGNSIQAWPAETDRLTRSSCRELRRAAPRAAATASSKPSDDAWLRLTSDRRRLDGSPCSILIKRRGCRNRRGII
jgi:hypothetical protein